MRSIALTGIWLRSTKVAPSGEPERGDAPAVDQDQRRARTEPAQRNRRGAVVVDRIGLVDGTGVVGRQLLQHLVQRDGTRASDLLARDHLHRRRRLRVGAAQARTRHLHRLELAARRRSTRPALAAASACEKTSAAAATSGRHCIFVPSRRRRRRRGRAVCPLCGALGHRRPAERRPFGGRSSARSGGSSAPARVHTVRRPGSSGDMDFCREPPHSRRSGPTDRPMHPFLIRRRSSAIEIVGRWMFARRRCSPR